MDKEELVAISIRIPKSQHAVIKAEAIAQHRSINMQIQHWLDQGWLRELPQINNRMEEELKDSNK